MGVSADCLVQPFTYSMPGMLQGLTDNTQISEDRATAVALLGELLNAAVKHSLFLIANML